MRVRMRLTVRKDLHLDAPAFLAAPDPHAALRNGARYATDGIGPDLLVAARDAVRRMIDWLVREHGLEAGAGLPAVQRRRRPAHQRDRRRAELHRHRLLPAGIFE